MVEILDLKIEKREQQEQAMDPFLAERMKNQLIYSTDLMAYQIDPNHKHDSGIVCEVK